MIKLEKIAKLIERKRYTNSLVGFIAWIKDKIFTKFLGHKIPVIEINESMAVIGNLKVASTALSKALKKDWGELVSKKYLKNKNYKKIFAFVRNPYSRIVSAYKHTIKRDFIFPLVRFHKFNQSMTFEEFVEAIYKIPNENCDGHFIPQSLLLTDLSGALIPTKIFKFENLQEGFNILCEESDINKTELEKVNSAPDGPDFMTYYNSRTIKLINKKYDKDFKMFGYNKIDPESMVKLTR